MKSKDRLSYIHAEVAALQEALETEGDTGRKAIFNAAEMRKSAARLVILLSEDRYNFKRQNATVGA